MSKTVHACCIKTVKKTVDIHGYMTIIVITTMLVC